MFYYRAFFLVEDWDRNRGDEVVTSANILISINSCPSYRVIVPEEDKRPGHHLQVIQHFVLHLYLGVHLAKPA